MALPTNPSDNDVAQAANGAWYRYIAASDTWTIATPASFSWTVDNSTWSQLIATRRVWTSISGVSYTVNADGVYRITAQADLPGFTNQSLGMRVLIDGTTFVTSTNRSWNSVEVGVNISHQASLATGQIVTVHVVTNRNNSTVTGSLQVGNVVGI